MIKQRNQSRQVLFYISNTHLYTLVCRFHVNKEGYWFLNRPPPFPPRTLPFWQMMVNNPLKIQIGSTVFNKLLLFIEKYLYYHKNDGSASIYGMMREERSFKFKFESWQPIIGGVMKVKKANRLMPIIDEKWVIHLQKVDTLLMIGI